MRSLLEWLLALVVLAGVVRVAGPVFGRLFPLSPGPAPVTLVESALPDLPTGVPAGAESAPLMILVDGTEVRLGMTEEELRTGPLSQWMAGPAVVEKGVIGERVILPFRSDRTRFWVVVDRIDTDRAREVTAIYVR
ncbi:MAG: hypothetical protein OEW19_00825 [Acidobacteriota bacterium]|nr:hypothetical protein [Acidobacteriota bacterium]